MGDHQHGAVEVVEHRARAARAGHVEVRLGLVEQQHVGPARQAGGERDELALAAAQLAGRHRELVVDARASSSSCAPRPRRGRRPARPSCASSRSWCASARVIASRSEASAGSASRRSTACSSASSSASSGRAARTVASGVRSSPWTICGRKREDEAAPARDRAGVGRPRDRRGSRSSVDLPPPLGPRTPIARCRRRRRGRAPSQDRAAAERLGEAACGERSGTVAMWATAVRSQQSRQPHRCTCAPRVRSRPSKRPITRAGRRRQSRGALDDADAVVWAGRTRTRSRSAPAIACAGCSCRPRASSAWLGRVDARSVTFTSAAGAYAAAGRRARAGAAARRRARGSAEYARAGHAGTRRQRPLDGLDGGGRRRRRHRARADRAARAARRRGRSR